MRFFVYMLVVISSMLASGGVAAFLDAVQLDPVQGVFAAISVRDSERSEAWYSRHFGLTETFRYKSDNGELKLVVLSGNGMTVEIQQHAGATPPATPAGKPYLNQGIFKVGFFVANIDEAVKQLKLDGAVVIVPAFNDSNSKTRTAVVADLDGNYLQLFQRNGTR